MKIGTGKVPFRYVNWVRMLCRCCLLHNFPLCVSLSIEKNLIITTIVIMLIIVCCKLDNIIINRFYSNLWAWQRDISLQATCPMLL